MTYSEVEKNQNSIYSGSLCTEDETLSRCLTRHLCQQVKGASFLTPKTRLLA